MFTFLPVIRFGDGEYHGHCQERSMILLLDEQNGDESILTSQLIGEKVPTTIGKTIGNAGFGLLDLENAG